VGHGQVPENCKVSLEEWSDEIMYAPIDSGPMMRNRGIPRAPPRPPRNIVDYGSTLNKRRMQQQESQRV
jgi:hypothetical protein